MKFRILAVQPLIQKILVGFIGVLLFFFFFDLFFPSPALAALGFTELGSVVDSETLINSFFGMPFETGDINGDGYLDLVIAAKGYSTNKGRLYVFFGGTSLDTTADIIINGAANGDYLPTSDTYSFGVGDIDKDGYGDIVVGAYSNDDDGINYGRGYIFFGSATLTGTLTANSTDAQVILSGDATTKFNLGVSSALGDFNGDGNLDVAISAYQNTVAGAVHIYFGNGTKNLDTTADVTLTVTGSSSLGRDKITVGDVSGDGYDDLLVSESEVNQAEVYLFYGGASMNATYDVKFSGEATADRLTRGAMDIKDIDKDGYDDVCLGAYSNDTSAANAGRVYCFFGSSNLSGDKTVAANADLTINGPAANDNFGRSLFLSDINNDGNRDLIVGAYQATGSLNGYVNTYLGNGTKSFDTTSDLTITAASISETGKQLGNWVFSGDLDNDGWPDLLVTSGTGGNGTGSSGRVHIFEVNHGTPSISVNGVGSTGDSTPTLTGTATDLSTNIGGVQWSVSSSSLGTWTSCSADDGSFNSMSEKFSCNLPFALPDGGYTIYFRTYDDNAVFMPSRNYGRLDLSINTDTTSPEISELAIANVSTVAQYQVYQLDFSNRMPSFSGKAFDTYQSSPQTNNDGTKTTFEKVCSGPDKITLTLKKLKEGGNPSATNPVYLSHLTKEYTLIDIKDNGSKMEKSTHFFITTPYPLVDGYYQVNLSLKDKAGNTYDQPAFYLSLNYSSYTNLPAGKAGATKDKQEQSKDLTQTKTKISGTKEALTEKMENTIIEPTLEPKPSPTLVLLPTKSQSKSQSGLLPLIHSFFTKILEWVRKI